MSVESVKLALSAAIGALDEFENLTTSACAAESVATLINQKLYDGDLLEAIGQRIYSRPQAQWSDERSLRLYHKFQLWFYWHVRKLSFIPDKVLSDDEMASHIDQVAHCLNAPVITNLVPYRALIRQALSMFRATERIKDLLRDMMIVFGHYKEALKRDDGGDGCGCDSDDSYELDDAEEVFRNATFFLFDELATDPAFEFREEMMLGMRLHPKTQNLDGQFSLCLQQEEEDKLRLENAERARKRAEEEKRRKRVAEEAQLTLHRIIDY